jgi:cytochrome d ubiquinol oxidase subunit II
MLETIWFILWGVLWGVYFMLDGFDLGVGTLMPFLGKDDLDRRLMYNATGPFWDGNEVWLITAGGATFAAFPRTYAVMFSGLYSALLIILFALIVRGVSFEFRGKEDSTSWKRLWDTCFFVGSFIPALLFGVAFANLFKGLPIDAQGIYRGTIFTLLNPYGLLGGALFVLLFLVHGAIWLAVKTQGGLQERAQALAGKLWYVLLAVAVVFLVYSRFATRLYENYYSHPVLLVVPILSVVGLVLVKPFLSGGRHLAAWVSSSLTILSSTFFGIVGLYPNMIPSTINPEYSLTIFNASSTPLTLKIMLVVALVFVPIVIAYQAWSYRLFKEKVTERDLGYEEAY